MLELGKFKALVAYRNEEQGWYLVDETGDEVLLPNKFVPEGMEKGDEINVFIYLDNEERITATTQIPKINLNEFAYLEVMDVNKYGAFVDWGVDKQLMIPYSEQSNKMEIGRKYLVYLRFDDKSDRLVGSNKLNKFLDNEELDINENDEVDLIIADETDLGRNVIINHKFRGLIYSNQIFKKIYYGNVLKGFIKSIREDGRVDVVLEKQGYKNVIEPNSKKILKHLQDNNGYVPLTDKSDPEDIKLTFEMSKKNFKKAIGSLYREKIVRLEKDGVYLI